MLRSMSKVRRTSGGQLTMKAILLAALASLTACHREPDPEGIGNSGPAAVRVAAVESKRRMAMEEVVGSVRARLHAGVEAKVSGKIERMVAVPGLTVKAGDLLVELDAREIKAKLDQALAVREQTEQELRRATGLLKNRAISQQEFELAQSRARVAAAEVTEGETMLGYTKIVAPFSGMVTRKLADVGDLAAPGKLLLEMEDPAALRLEADVPETLIDRIKVGDRFAMRIASLTNSLEGVSSEVTPVADPGSRTFLVKVDLPETAGLRVGQFGRVLIPVGEGAALRVPTAAVVHRGQMEVVFVVADGRARLRLVRTGKRIGEETEVVSGISINEQVVSEGAANLIDGQAVVMK